MISKHHFMENGDGVHLMNGEYSLCGDAFDIGAVDDEVENMRDTKRKTVTCRECARVIGYCRGVKVSRQEGKGNE